jgi:hypothetical protein
MTTLHLRAQIGSTGHSGILWKMHVVSSSDRSL